MATESSVTIPEITISVKTEYKKGQEGSEVEIMSELQHVVLPETLDKEIPRSEELDKTEDKMTIEDHFKEDLLEEDPSTTKPNP